MLKKSIRRLGALAMVLADVYKRQVYRITRPAAFATGCLRYTYEWRMLMRKKVRKSLAFLLALALVVSVMSGLGLSVSADDAQNEPVVTETEGEPAEEKLKAEENLSLIHI